MKYIGCCLVLIKSFVMYFLIILSESSWIFVSRKSGIIIDVQLGRVWLVKICIYIVQNFMFRLNNEISIFNVVIVCKGVVEKDVIFCQVKVSIFFKGYFDLLVKCLQWVYLIWVVWNLSCGIRLCRKILFFGKVCSVLMVCWFISW